MAVKKLKAQVDFTLESKQFKSELKLLTQGLKSLDPYVKKVGQTLKSLGTEFGVAQKSMNQFQSVNKIIQQSSYNALNTSATKTTASLKSLGTTGTKAAEQVKQVGTATEQTGKKVDSMGIYLDRTAKKAHVMTDANAKTRGGLDRLGQATTGLVGKFEKAGYKFDATSQKNIKLAAAAEKAAPKIKSVGVSAAKTGQQLTQSGQAAGKAGQQYTTMGNNAGQAGQKMASLSNQSKQAGGAMKSVEQSSTGMSTSITASVQSTVALTQGIQGSVAAYRDMHQVQIDVEAKEVSITQIEIGLEKALVDVAAEERALTQARKDGSLSTEELADRTAKLASEYKQIENDQKDLRVNTEELALVKEKVNDAYINFATTIAQTAVGAYGTLASFMTKDTKNTIKNLAAKISSIGGNSKLAASNTATGLSFGGLSTAAKGAAVSLKGVGTSIKGVMIAMGPIGWALIGITALWGAWETNLFGFRDIIHQVIDELQKAWDVIKWVIPVLGLLDEGLKSMNVNLGESVDAWQEEERAEREAAKTMEDTTDTIHGVGTELGSTEGAITSMAGVAATSNPVMAKSFEALGIDSTKSLNSIGISMGTTLPKELQKLTMTAKQKNAEITKSYNNLKIDMASIMGGIVREHEQGSAEQKKALDAMVDHFGPLIVQMREMGPEGQQMANKLLSEMSRTAQGYNIDTNTIITDLLSFGSAQQELADKVEAENRAMMESYANMGQGVGGVLNGIGIQLSTTMPESLSFLTLNTEEQTAAITATYGQLELDIATVMGGIARTFEDGSEQQGEALNAMVAHFNPLIAKMGEMGPEGKKMADKLREQVGMVATQYKLDLGKAGDAIDEFLKKNDRLKLAAGTLATGPIGSPYWVTDDTEGGGSGTGNPIGGLGACTCTMEGGNNGSNSGGTGTSPNIAPGTLETGPQGSPYWSTVGDDPNNPDTETEPPDPYEQNDDGSYVNPTEGGQQTNNLHVGGTRQEDAARALNAPYMELEDVTYFGIYYKKIINTKYNTAEETHSLSRRTRWDSEPKAREALAETGLRLVTTIHATVGPYETPTKPVVKLLTSQLSPAIIYYMNINRGEYLVFGHKNKGAAKAYVYTKDEPAPGYSEQEAGWAYFDEDFGVTTTEGNELPDHANPDDPTQVTGGRTQVILPPPPAKDAKPTLAIFSPRLETETGTWGGEPAHYIALRWDGVNIRDTVRNNLKTFTAEYTIHGPLIADNKDEELYIKNTGTSTLTLTRVIHNTYSKTWRLGPLFRHCRRTVKLFAVSRGIQSTPITFELAADAMATGPPTPTLGEGGREVDSGIPGLIYSDTEHQHQLPDVSLATEPEPTPALPSTPYIEPTRLPSTPHIEPTRLPSNPHIPAPTTTTDEPNSDGITLRDIIEVHQ